ncbi:hypothetical protein ACOSQ3_006775 [Xanthoceras sorbifolium]
MASARSQNFFYIFVATATAVATCGRGTRSRCSLECAHRLPRERALVARVVALLSARFLTISSRAVHRDLWSRWLVALLTARFCHFHREQAIATCGRGDWSRYSLPYFAFFTASEPSRPVVAVTRSRCSLVQFFNFSFFTIQSGPLEIIK